MKNLLIMGMVLLSTTAFAGNEKGNGAFIYSRTSKKLLDISQESLQKEFREVLSKRSELVFTSKACRKPVDLRVLSKMVDNMTYDYKGSSPATNPEGKVEERAFRINEKGQIEALELYFSSFIDAYFRYVEVTTKDDKAKIISPVKKAIIHEGLHEFNYGEMEARLCAEDLFKTLDEARCDVGRTVKRLATYLVNDKVSPNAITEEEIFGQTNPYSMRDVHNRLVKLSVTHSKDVRYSDIEMTMAELKHNVLGQEKSRKFDMSFDEMNCK